LPFQATDGIEEVGCRMRILLGRLQRYDKKIEFHLQAAGTKGFTNPALEAVALHGIAESTGNGQSQSSVTEGISSIDETNAATTDTPAMTHGGKIRFRA